MGAQKEGKESSLARAVVADEDGFAAGWEAEGYGLRRGRAGVNGQRDGASYRSEAS